MVESNKKKKRKAAPKDETAVERTKRLTDFRVSRVIKDLGSVSNLTGASYVLTAEQKEEILAALDKGLKGVAAAFGGTATTATGFSLTK